MSGEWPSGKYGAILADPPWAFNLWWGGRSNKTPAGVPSRATEPHYEVMREDELCALPIGDLAADDCVLFLWICWPVLEWSLRVVKAWGFEYKTCAFCWVKANAKQIDMFRDDLTPHMTLGYWTRSNSEVCLLATKGKPKRLAADVRQAIVEPRREHSRKPDGVHDRIERLVAGPYLELFARESTRPGWTFWGNESTRFNQKRAAE
jgi:N6-adenosine-specific RNA methylase IME4